MTRAFQIEVLKVLGFEFLVSGSHGKSAQVRVLTFEEAAELSTFGSKVVHPAAVLPAWQAGVPMSVRNSMAPEDPGVACVFCVGCVGCVNY